MSEFLPKDHQLMIGEHNYLHNGLGMQYPSTFNHMNMVNFQQMFWIMVFFQQAFNRSNLFLLDASADDLDSPIDVTPRLSIFPEFLINMAYLTLIYSTFSCNIELYL